MQKRILQEEISFWDLFARFFAQLRIPDYLLERELALFLGSLCKCDYLMAAKFDNYLAHGQL
jgi:hypothetical protein